VSRPRTRVARTARDRARTEQIHYLKQIVVGVDGANARNGAGRAGSSPNFRISRRCCGTTARDAEIAQATEEAELSTGPSGKGRNVWLCFGYVLASEQARMVALHDCDIVTYNRELLARLCYPVAHPAFGFDFCKGYYARISSKLNGRVMRLLVTPLLRALKSIVGPHPFLIYLDTFRYPLAGEVAMDVDLVRRNRIPFDWGLEVGCWRKSSAIALRAPFVRPSSVTTTITNTRNSSPRDPEKGLNRMAVDIIRSIFRRMASEGIKLDQGLFETLQFAYIRQAEDTLRAYGADAAMNGLAFPRHEEETAVATFGRSIREAARRHVEDPMLWPLIPNWNRVESALPTFLDELRDAVRLDNPLESTD